MSGAVRSRGPLPTFAVAVVFVLLCASLPSATLAPKTGGISLAKGASWDRPNEVDQIPPCVEAEGGNLPTCGAFEAVYDPVDGYVLGYSICMVSNTVYGSCTWKYSDGTWTNINPSSGPLPPPLVEESFVWDSADRCAVLFGGLDYTGGVLKTVWEFKGGVWTNLTNAVSPAGRFTFFTRAAYDSSDGYVVSVWQNFGLPAGVSYTLTFRAGVWTNVTNSSNESGLPLEPTAADAPLDNGALFFGGFNGSPRNSTNETWLFSEGSWRELPLAHAPPVRVGESIVYDSLDGYDLLVGGAALACEQGNLCPLSDEWTFAHGRWTNVTSTLRGNPPVEADGVLVTDLADGYVLECLGYAGVDNATGYEIPQLTIYTYLNGTWTESISPASPVISWDYLGLLIVVGIAGLVGVAYGLRRRKDGPNRPPSD